jgi:hypothetical protein
MSQVDAEVRGLVAQLSRAQTVIEELLENIELRKQLGEIQEERIRLLKATLEVISRQKLGVLTSAGYDQAWPYWDKLYDIIRRWRAELHEWECAISGDFNDGEYADGWEELAAEKQQLHAMAIYMGLDVPLAEKEDLPF